MAMTSSDVIVIRTKIDLLYQLAKELRGHWPDADFDETIHEIADTYEARARSFENDLANDGKQ